MPHPFDVTPSVVLADETATIAIRGRFIHSDLRLKSSIAVEYIPMDGLLPDGKLPGWTMGDGNPITDRPAAQTIPFDFDKQTGTLKLTVHFRGEGEHTFRLVFGNDPAVTISVYSLKPDLMTLRPFRGDMHIHSRFSNCNNDRATPEYYVAANAALGLDFMSISDHKQILPALAARDFTENWGTNIHAYPGEEVHLHHLHNHHILNFGGSQGVSNFMRNNPDAYKDELKPYLENIPQDLDPLLRELLATGNFIFDKIRQFGGLSILCHPYWQPASRFFLPTAVLEHLCRTPHFDAIELLGLGGTTNPCLREMNQYCIAFWHDLCIRSGRQIPVVGNNDAHNVRTLGQNCSIVFAPENSCQNIIDAVKANRSVAVDKAPHEFPRCYGDFRLVRFSYFLLRSYYPMHDEICTRESQLLFDAIADEASVNVQDFQRLTSRMKALNDAFWAK